ncbi:outer membrane family protein [Helicobacter saguini]|uniref:Outer membrane family protein n=1 Tax=Helicobacter saguini TaxID=1548018 RepID=A0A6L7D538_9HELI|nr:outer membrane family protein [Helicobacter saguini]MWV69274.1 hypothetical protein [Helicobacter saguini]
MQIYKNKQEILKIDKTLDIKKLLNVSRILRNIESKNVDNKKDSIESKNLQNLDSKDVKESKNVLLIASAIFICSQTFAFSKDSNKFIESKANFKILDSKQDSIKLADSKNTESKDEFIQDSTQEDLLDLEAPKNIESKAKQKPKFFTFYGAVGSFNRFGFNDQNIDIAANQYPTDSLMSIYTEGNIKLDFLHFIESWQIDSLNFVIGGALGGIIYDSTKNQAAAAGGLGHWYVGYYSGFLGNESDNISNARNYVNHNLYLDFKWKGLGLKIGRYKSWMDQQSAYTQGFNIDYTYKFSDFFTLKPWWFSSFGRAYAYAQWIYDWYSERTTDFNNDGTADANLGKHAFGSDFVLGQISNLNGVKSGFNLTLRPYLWFYPSDFTAIGGRVIHEQHFGNNFGMKLQLQGYFITINDKYVGGRYDGDVREKNATNLNFVAEGFYKSWGAAFGIYKNFGHPNSRFGGYPIYIDKWTASVYDIGRSKADITSKNALSEYFFIVKNFDTSFGNSSAKILARFTQSPRSDEISIGLILSHTFKNALTLGVKIEYFSDTTKRGYYINPSYSTILLQNNRTDDRSHAFITADYAF